MNQKEFDERRKIAEKWWPKPYTGPNETARIMAMQGLLADAVMSLLPNGERIVRTEGHVAGCQCQTCNEPVAPTAETMHVDGCLCPWCGDPSDITEVVMASRVETCVKCGRQEKDPIKWIIAKAQTPDQEDLWYCPECTTYKGD